MQRRFYRVKHAIKDAPKFKTLEMQLSITEEDLGVKVRKAFDLAKSAGQELNLSFGRAAG